MRLLFAGTPVAAVPALAALLDSQHEVVAVLTRADAPAGRGRQLRASPVRAAADAASVPVITARPRDLGFLDQITALGAQAGVVVAYGELLRPDVLATMPRGWINLHFSVLPAWRGAAPVQRAIMAGDDLTGATTFVLDEGMDTGPVLSHLTEAIRPRDTAGELLSRLARSGAGLLVTTLDAYEAGHLVPTPQIGPATLAPKLTKLDARVDFAKPALAVDRLVRGCTPAPGAWTECAGARLGLGPVTTHPQAQGLAPGEVRVTKSEVLVGTATTAVVLGEVQATSKRAMPALDWARGARLGEGARFG